MKKLIINILKIGVPLVFGVYLLWYFYDIMEEDEKVALFHHMKEANYLWLLLSMVLAFLSHLSRAYRWRYLIDPLGKRIGLWNAYHAIMIGYLFNLFVPRAGEATRAIVLSKTEKVPFAKLFGTIIAERAVDLIMLAIICAATIYFQYENLDLITSRMDVLNQQLTADSSGSDDGSGFPFKIVILSVLGIGALFGLALFIFKSSFRKKVVDLFKGFLEGGLSIFKSKNPWAFTFHSVLIWVLYIMMFVFCCYSIEETSDMPIGGIFAGFVAGTIGFIIVQGGIGVYQALVGLVITTYLYPEFENPIHSVGLALGWLIWLSQNLLILLLGLISYLLNIKNVTLVKNEEINTVES